MPSVIAENLGADPKAVSARLSELEGRGKIVRFPDRSAALKAHQTG
jgi:DNA-binding Lrp family transcriptional regulator